MADTQPRTENKVSIWTKCCELYESEGGRMMANDGMWGRTLTKKCNALHTSAQDASSRSCWQSLLSPIDFHSHKPQEKHISRTLTLYSYVLIAASSVYGTLYTSQQQLDNSSSPTSLHQKLKVGLWRSRRGHCSGTQLFLEPQANLYRENDVTHLHCIYTGRHFSGAHYQRVFLKRTFCRVVRLVVVCWPRSSWCWPDWWLYTHVLLLNGFGAHVRCCWSSRFTCLFLFAFPEPPPCTISIQSFLSFLFCPRRLFSSLFLGCCLR